MLSSSALGGLLLAVSIGSIWASFDVMFEKFEQLNGTEIVSVKLRVRKYNRTISVLAGIMDLKEVADNNLEVGIRCAYSSKGNNQFNQYPMKIARTKMCDFLNNDWREYYPYFENSSNLPKVGECPVQPMEFYFNDMVLDSNMFPPYLPHGLWRMSISLYRPGVDIPVILVEVYFKVAAVGVL
ncbi:uncharacterized protein LOC109415309 [Aedes albopictus]|uniref:Secreted protein n=1 Tax=Aedes albopictus TaxID=7160 RepID=A0ABM1XS25_AEDAL|nr:uncharacterized protein LOC109415309 [Aedes albopictus]KXJ81111.1 hypothetical protein RP20_CCG021726 [Aedes albopictus]